jgi:hypothetical protein
MILLEIEDRRIAISLSQGRKAKAYHGQCRQSISVVRF